MDWGLRTRALFVAGLLAACSLVMGVASLGVGGWWPLTVFWALTANRAFDAGRRSAGWTARGCSPAECATLWPTERLS